MLWYQTSKEEDIYKEREREKLLYYDQGFGSTSNNVKQRLATPVKSQEMLKSQRNSVTGTSSL